MGLLSRFLQRRRRRESAIPAAEPSDPPAASAEVEPVGQPFEDVGQPINLTLGSPTDITGLLGMIGTAMQTGQFQVQQSESQVIDLRGSGLREEIVEAMRQSGVDPEGQGQIDAGQYGDLQQRILDALQSHGVDVAQGGEIPPPAGGDSKPA